MKYYSINGTILPAEKAVIGVTDLALLRAFGIFDYFRFKDGKAVFMDDHLARFHRSAKMMGLEIPFSNEALKKQILDLAKANGYLNAGMQMILTGGYSVDGFTPTKPNLIILVRPFIPHPEFKYKNGVKLILWKYQREIPEVKTINYIVPILSLKKREETGATDILYHDGKHISECSRANLFIVTPDDKLVTPEKGVLKGITRKHILEIAKTFYEIELRDLSIDEVKNAKEIFLSNSSQRIMPVVQIDDFTIGDGKPGAITLQLTKLLQLHIEELMEKEIAF